MINIRRHIGHARLPDRVRLEARRARRSLAIYLVALAVAIASAANILHNINVQLPWHDEAVAHIAVDNAKGIVPGKQEVRWAGVVVGKMTQVKLVAGQPVVTITYDPRYGPLYRDARLRLRPQTALADMFMHIESPGHSSAGKLGSGILAAERTRVPVDIADVLNVFAADTRADMKQAIDEAGRGLADNGAQLRAAFAELAPFLRSAQRLTAEFAERRELTSRLVHNFRLMVEELGVRDRTLTRLVTSGDMALGELQSVQEPLGALLEGLPPTLTDMQASFARLQSTLDAVDPALVRLLPAAEAMPAGLRALQRFSDQAGPSLLALRKPIRWLAPLAAQLRPSSAALADAFTRMAPQAPRYDRITALIVPCELAVNKFFQWTPSVLKFSDANGAYPRGNSVSSSSTGVQSQRDAVLEHHPGCTTGKAAQP